MRHLPSIIPREKNEMMGKYKQGDHVKFEVTGSASADSEWMWLRVDDSDDDEEVVFGRLDSQPVVNTDMRLGQELAVSYKKIRDHRRFEN
jgi:uncharacterized protein YegJ (DUF2314 family)